jgi:hypothetical protein
MKHLMLAVGCAALLGAGPSAGLGAGPSAALGTGLGAGQQAARGTMDWIAEDYVKLVLAIGQHDDDYVDAYYGPPEWRTEAEASKTALDALAKRAADLSGALDREKPPADEWGQLRLRYLRRQLEAVSARLRMLKGERLSFDEESRALYDAVAPTQPESHFQGILDRLEKRLPGDGPLITRYERFRRDFVIPKDRQDKVFRAAIDACRQRTVKHISLPGGEEFTLEYVTGKSWSGYNWYQGNFRSVIQMNVDLPIYVDRALDLACHEGYPGHHVLNVLIEKNLVRDRGWVEFTVYPLFSPPSLIAEGTANYGIEMAFPGAERLAFERAVLFPMAGIDPARAGEYYEVQQMVDALAYAGNEAARRYLNGEIDAAQAADWLERYALMGRQRAEQRVRFFDQYRAYVINYNLGKDMVRRYIEGRAGDDPAKRWQEFEKLLTTPTLPSDLLRGALPPGPPDWRPRGAPMPRSGRQARSLRSLAPDDSPEDSSSEF